MRQHDQDANDLWLYFLEVISWAKRLFPQKRRAYERQGGCCAECGDHFAFEDMQGDHITSWCQGGRTVDDNLQMLCRTCAVPATMTKVVIDVMAEKKNKEFVPIGIKFRADLAERLENYKVIEKALEKYLDEVAPVSE